MSDSDRKRVELPRCTFLLVHGTWGRGFNPSDPFIDTERFLPGNTLPAPRWFELGSPLLSRLQAALADKVDPVFVAFNWSGANSVFERDEAAIELCRQIEAGLAASEDIVIIAHSHGGNVALRALELLGSHASRVRLVTLATPFLRLRAAEPQSGRMFYVFFPIAFFMALLPTLSRWALPSLPDLTDPSFAHAFELWFGRLLDLLPAAAIGSIAVAFLAIRYCLNLSGRGRWGEHPDRLARAAHYDTNTPTPPRMLVLRGVDDEAGFALTLGALGSRLTFLLVAEWIPRIFFRAAVGLLSVVIVGWMIGAGDIGIAGYVWLMHIVSVWLLVLVAVPGLCKTAFGREFLFGSLRCEIAVDSSPDGSKTIEVVTLDSNPVAFSNPFRLRDIPFGRLLARLWPRSAQDAGEAAANSKLRHAIYNHPLAAEQITAWLFQSKGSS